MFDDRALKLKWDHDPLVYHDCGLTGYTGTDPDKVMAVSMMPAKRIQIGPRGLYKGALAELPNGDLVVCPCDGLTPSWPIRIYKSSDGGFTWSPIEHTPLFGKEPGLTCLANGNLLLTMEHKDASVACSSDGGHTWKVTHMRDMLPDLPNSGGITTVRTPLQFSDGRTTLVRCWAHYEGLYDAPRSRVFLFHSYDFGMTWSEIEEIPTWDDSFGMFCEADFLQLPNGTILSTSRFEFDHPISGAQPPWPPNSVPNDHAAGHMVLIESSDGGTTWVGPRDFLNYSEVQGQLTLLKDGRILCSYTNYHLPFGACAVVSNDLGKTWDFEHPYQLAISNSVCTGWATTRQLSDGHLLTVYASEPYHLEPMESGRYVFQCVHWNVP